MNLRTSKLQPIYEKMRRVMNQMSAVRNELNSLDIDEPDYAAMRSKLRKSLIQLMIVGLMKHQSHSPSESCSA